MNNSTSAMSQYCLKEGYQSREKPEYYVAHDTGIDWQQAVYDYAYTLAKQYQCHTVIDMGCGDGVKLQSFASEFSVIGLDYGENIDYCQQQYPESLWVNCDLEDATTYPKWDGSILSGALIICADVIEHLAEPTILLDVLRNWLKYARAIVLSTPERDLVRGNNHMGPPLNPCHVREWNTDELLCLLAQSGLHVQSLRCVPAYSGSNQDETMMVTLTGVIPKMKVEL